MQNVIIQSCRLLVIAFYFMPLTYAKPKKAEFKSHELFVLRVVNSMVKEERWWNKSQLGQVIVVYREASEKSEVLAKIKIHMDLHPIDFYKMFKTKKATTEFDISSDAKDGEFYHVYYQGKSAWIRYDKNIFRRVLSIEEWLIKSWPYLNVHKVKFYDEIGGRAVDVLGALKNIPKDGLIPFKGYTKSSSYKWVDGRLWIKVKVDLNSACYLGPSSLGMDYVSNTKSFWVLPFSKNGESYIKVNNLGNDCNDRT